MIARFAHLLATGISLVAATNSYAQQTHWIPLPDGMHVQLLRDTTNKHRVAFLVNLNSYEISSFHASSSLYGSQNYDTEMTGWTYYRDGDPYITIASYSTEDWKFGASSGDFWWQNHSNVTNLGDPSYKLIFRLSNDNFTESTTFTYYIDQVPEPSTNILAILGCAVVGLAVIRRSRKSNIISPI